MEKLVLESYKYSINGSIPAIASKSHAHRLIIAASLSDRPSKLCINTTSNDIEATISCMKILGANFVPFDGGYEVTPIPVVDAENVYDARGDAESYIGTVSVTNTDGTDSSAAGASGAAQIDVGESGSTLRFLLPVLGVLGKDADITMHGRLSERPLSPLYEEMEKHGIKLSPVGTNPFSLRGKMSGGIYNIAGNVSSQYITGLLLALPLAKEDSEIRIMGQLMSRPYVDITLSVLDSFGIQYEEIRSDGLWNPGVDGLQEQGTDGLQNPGVDGVQDPGIDGVQEQGTDGIQDSEREESQEPVTEELQNPGVEGLQEQRIEELQGLEDAAVSTVFRIKGSQRYIAPSIYSVTGDWSNAAFFLSAGALSKKGVTVTGLDMSSKQGDKAILDILEAFGASVTIQPPGYSESARESGKADVTVMGGALHGIDIDAADIPDLVPIISVVAAFSEGTTVIRNIERLRIKESDRVKTVIEMITRLGGDISEKPEPGKEKKTALFINGKKHLSGGTVNSHNDHRIAMAAAIAGIKCLGPVEIEDPFAVRKSYPGFYDDLKKLYK